MSRPYRAAKFILGTSTWGFTPGCHIVGFQPREQHRIASGLDAVLLEGVRSPHRPYGKATLDYLQSRTPNTVPQNSTRNPQTLKSRC